MTETDKMKSEEEKDFYHWLLELKYYGYISEIRYEPESFVLAEDVKIQVIKQLKTKQLIKEKTLLHRHEYTPDFVFVLERPLPVQVFYPGQGILYVDTKGTFDRFKSVREFSINQKWMLDKHKIYVNKIIPKKLFKKTFVPLKCRGVTGKRFSGFPAVNEFLGILN